MSQRLPQVSIGMPVYNGEKFIREALDSLLAQTFTDFELIISDNASTDGTEAICREYAARDPRIRYVRQSENRGAIANFQFVLDEAVGEYFMWAAADDVWGERWIEVLLPVAENCDCISFGMLESIDEKGWVIEHLANYRRFIFRGNKTLRRLKYFLEPACLGKANPIYGIFRKSLMTRQVFALLSAGRYGGDMLMLYVFLLGASIKFGGEVILKKRIHMECAGGGLVKNKEQFKNRLLLFFIGFFRSPMLLDYWLLSNLKERFILILAYPLAILRHIFIALRMQITKILRVFV